MEEIPVSLLLHIVSFDSHCSFLLAQAYPRYGKWTLEMENQKRLEDMFLVKEEILIGGGVAKTTMCKKRFHGRFSPSMSYPNGVKGYHFNGLLHREDGPAIVHSTGENWYKHGILNREDGPAITNRLENGLVTERWYKNGLAHRGDGPAITENIDGKNTLMWFIEGEFIKQIKE